jgi:spore maturation protein SpmB
MAPLMGLVGLPGRASLVFFFSVFLNIYSAIAVALTMSLDMRSATILAIMCLTAHNLIVETAVMKKTGSSGTKMVFLRIGLAFGAAYAFNFLLPDYLRSVPFSSITAASTRLDFLGALAAWGITTTSLALKIALIVLGVMVAQRLLEEFKTMDILSRFFAPVMSFLGLPRESSFLLIVINVVGYAYGAGIVEEQVKSGRMKPQEGDLFNHHAGVCNSLMEDTILFLAVGVPLFWITLPRIALALLAVWIERARRRIFRRSFRVGTV